MRVAFGLCGCGCRWAWCGRRTDTVPGSLSPTASSLLRMTITDLYLQLLIVVIEAAVGGVQWPPRVVAIILVVMIALPVAAAAALAAAVGVTTTLSMVAIQVETQVAARRSVRFASMTSTRIFAGATWYVYVLSAHLLFLHWLYSEGHSVCLSVYISTCLCVWSLTVCLLVDNALRPPVPQRLPAAVARDEAGMPHLQKRLAASRTLDWLIDWLIDWLTSTYWYKSVSHSQPVSQNWTEF